VNLNAAVTIRDAGGRVVADAVDTEARTSPDLRRRGRRGLHVSVNDIDFRATAHSSTA